MPERHISVLAAEAIFWLAPKIGGRYLDGTLGLGGHTKKIIEAAQGEATVIGIDRDKCALEQAKIRLGSLGSQVIFAHEHFKFFDKVLHKLSWGSLNGAIVDLGVSSMQLDVASRGFSFLNDGPLDMRMDQSDGQTSASNIINKAPLTELCRIFRDYGEEPMAFRIAKAVIQARENSGSITTTKVLADIVYNAYPQKWRKTAKNHPATRVFQALRIAVNRELEELEIFLRKIPDYIAPGGRIVIISFHSLEDRIVKTIFKEQERGCSCPESYGACVCGGTKKLKILSKKIIVPSQDEMRANSRSRSAKMRVAERI